MSDPETTPAVDKPPGKKGGSAVLSIALPALIAGAAAFGGAKFSSAHAAAPQPIIEHVAVTAPPPGPTVSLEPFVLLTPDSGKKMHAMKVTVAIEFEEKVKEDIMKSYTPRVRDAALGYLRALTYEDAIDGAKSDKIRADLLERFRTVGAVAASRVLITDLVVQ